MSNTNSVFSSDPNSGFQPLFAPHVEPMQKRPIAVEWFEKIAQQIGTDTRMGELGTWDVDRPSDAMTVNPGGSVHFGSAEAIAEVERMKQRGKDYVPPEIKRMRQKAMSDVQRLMERAEEQAEEIRQEAYQQGYLLGYERGYSDGDTKAQQDNLQSREEERVRLQTDITQFLECVEAERQRAWDDIEPQAMDLVFTLAKQVIKQEIDVSRTVAVSVIKNALRRVNESGALRVRVNPEDYETVRSHRSEILQVLNGSAAVEFVEDRRVGRGGAILETQNGNLDARIETQLEFVGDTLTQMKHMTFEQEAA
ncbi:MAG: hypothetical protein H7308_16215 [Chthonomonadaceae bacterium]|nr:hypothetical protein [Chthonomonadaceae bacterium]